MNLTIQVTQRGLSERIFRSSSPLCSQLAQTLGFKMKDKVEINLFRDWAAHLKEELLEYGYKLEKKTDDEIVHIYLNLLKRTVSPAPRLIKKASNFDCPIDLLPGLKNVEKIITKGGDLSPYLSRSLKKPNYSDPLLNHWGIHHIHLGDSVESDGFITRTGLLLFARFDNNNAYFINVLPHGSWSLQELVISLHENWPKSIEQYLLKGVLGTGYTAKDEDVATLRKANVNTAVEVSKNILYAPLGGGLTTSGISTEVVMKSDYYKHKLKLMQESVIDNIDVISSDAIKQNIDFPTNPKFSLEVRDDFIYAVEINSMLYVKLGTL